jgi:hypothetical protein
MAMKNLLPIDPNFKFSEEERNDLWHILWTPRKFRREDVMHFIDRLEEHCAFNFLRPIRRIKDDRAMVSAMIKTFKQAKTYFEILIPMSEQVFSPNNILRAPAKDGLVLLTRVIKILENAMPRPISHRPKAKLPAFIKRIGQDYERILDEKPKNGGVFLKVIRELLGILGLPRQDPRRAVRQALKDF